MSHRDAATLPLLFLSFSAPRWIEFIQTFWSIVLPAGGAILLILQIAYYWKALRK